MSIKKSNCQILITDALGYDLKTSPKSANEILNLLKDLLYIYYIHMYIYILLYIVFTTQIYAKPTKTSTLLDRICPKLEVTGNF